MGALILFGEFHKDVGGALGGGAVGMVPGEAPVEGADLRVDLAWECWQQISGLPKSSSSLSSSHAALSSSLSLSFSLSGTTAAAEARRGVDIGAGH